MLLDHTTMRVSSPMSSKVKNMQLLMSNEPIQGAVLGRQREWGNVGEGEREDVKMGGRNWCWHQQSSFSTFEVAKSQWPYTPPCSAGPCASRLSQQTWSALVSCCLSLVSGGESMATAWAAFAPAAFCSATAYNKFTNSTSWQKSEKSTGESDELAKWLGKWGGTKSNLALSNDIKLAHLRKEAG